MKAWILIWCLDNESNNKSVYENTQHVVIFQINDFCAYSDSFIASVPHQSIFLFFFFFFFPAHLSWLLAFFPLYDDAWYFLCIFLMVSSVFLTDTSLACNMYPQAEFLNLFIPGLRDFIYSHFHLLSLCGPHSYLYLQSWSTLRTPFSLLSPLFISFQFFFFFFFFFAFISNQHVPNGSLPEK